MSQVAAAVQRIIAPISEDLLAVDREVIDDLQSDIPLIKKISDYIVTAGGKRMRPIVLMLIARALGYQGKEHIFLATMIEYVHTASLLHDDVVDESDLRRGKPTAGFKWGNAAAILTGDFMYSRAFQLMVRTQNLRICEIVAGAVNRVSEGEVIQLLNIHDTTLDEARYFDVIERKTGVLFEAAARMASVVAGASKEVEDKMAEYALCLGRAFQIIDDVLDYTGSKDNIGKNLGTDLREGKMTMPLIYALRHCPEEDAKIIRTAVSSNDPDLESVTRVILASGAIDACIEAGKKEVSRGIDALNCFTMSSISFSNLPPHKLAILFTLPFSLIHAVRIHFFTGCPPHIFKSLNII